MGGEAGFCAGVGANRCAQRRLRIPGRTCATAPDRIWTAARELGRCARAEELAALVLGLERTDEEVFGDVRLHMLVLKAFVQKGRTVDALDYFEEMKIRGVKPDVIAYNFLLSALAKRRKLARVFELRREMDDHFIQPDSFTYAAVIEAFAAVGNAKAAWQQFEKMHKMHIRPDRIIFGVLAAASARSGSIALVERAIRRMRSYGMKPGVHTYNALLTACAKQGEIDHAVDVFKTMQAERVAPDCMTFTALMKAYAESGDLEGVVATFRESRMRMISPDVVQYAELIQAHARMGSIRLAEEAFAEMCASGVEPDRVIFSALMDAYGKSGRLARVRVLYDEMRARGFAPNNIVYNTLMDAHIRADDYDGAVGVFDELVRDQLERPSARTFTTLIYAYTKKLDFARAERTLRRMSDSGVRPLVSTFTTLIDAYSDAGDLEGVYRHYVSLKKDRSYKLNARVYNCMMRACAHFKLFRRVRKQYFDMRTRGVQPDARTFAILFSACQHFDSLGNVEEYMTTMRALGVETDVVVEAEYLKAVAKLGGIERALSAFERLEHRRHGHHHALVDILMGAGRINEALAEVKTLEAMSSTSQEQLSAFNAKISVLFLSSRREQGVTEVNRWLARTGTTVSAATFEIVLGDGTRNVEDVLAALDPAFLEDSSVGLLMKAGENLGRAEAVLYADRWRHDHNFARTVAGFNALFWALQQEDGRLQEIEALLDDKLASGLQLRMADFHAVMAVQARCAKVDAVHRSLSAMTRAGIEPTLSTFNLAAAAYANAASPRGVESVMVRMRKDGLEPDVTSYNWLADAYTRVGDDGRARHARKQVSHMAPPGT